MIERQGQPAFKVNKKPFNSSRRTKEKNQLDQLIKNLPTLTENKERKSSDFQKEKSSFFNSFINTILGWPASLLFGSHNGIEGELSHGRSRIN